MKTFANIFFNSRGNYNVCKFCCLSCRVYADYLTTAKYQPDWYISISTFYSEPIGIFLWFMQQTMQKCRALKKNVEKQKSVAGLGELLFELAPLWGMLQASVGSTTGGMWSQTKQQDCILVRLKFIFSNNRSSWPLYTKSSDPHPSLPVSKQLLHKVTTFNHKWRKTF